MGGLGFSELIIILAIALLVFGAGKLPQVGSSLGKAIRDFRRATSGMDEPEVTPSEPAASPEPLPPSQPQTQTASRPTAPAEKTPEA